MGANELPAYGCAGCAGKTNRRQFIASSTASAVAALVAAACAGGDAAVVTGPVALTVQVSNYPALANVGGMAEVDSGGTPVAVVRTGSDTFSAFSLICPHRGCTVGLTGSGFACPCHGARFSSSGTWTGGQRTSNLTALATSYDAAAGTLTISN